MANKGIDPQLKEISSYLTLTNGERLVIPEYQRAYSWSIYQCDKLWQDIENFIESGNTDPYFFGTIILDCSNDKNELHLIDGQQRTTTFLLLIKALQLQLQNLLTNFRVTEDSESLKEAMVDARNSTLKLLYNVDSQERFALLKDWSRVKGRIPLLNRSINEQFKQELSVILEAKTYEDAEQNCYKFARKQKDNKYTNFFRNFKFFYERLGHYKESRLQEFAIGLLYKCQIIEIRSWQTEQAITMFNSLNSTGMPLSDADIISAQMYSQAAEDRNAFNQKWTDVIQQTNALCTQDIVDLDSILQQYMYIYRAQTKEYVINSAKGQWTDVTTPGLRKFYINDHAEILKQPIELCDHFYKIAQIWENIKTYAVVKLLLKFNDNAKIFLIAYLYRFDISQITIDVVTEICELLMRLFAILELVDTGYSSTNFKTFLFTEAVKLVDANIPIEDIQKDFDEHISKKWSDDVLKQDINDYDKNVLVYLNEYVYAINKNISFSFQNTVNIEHIMPASGHNIEAIRRDAKIDTKEEFDLVVNKLGNKILLEEDINKSIGKEWFETKKQKTILEKSGYKDSKYLIAATLANYPSNVWTKEDIDKATAKVSSRLIAFIKNKRENAYSQENIE